MLVALQTSLAAKDLLLECLGEDGELIPGTGFLEDLEKEELTFPDALHVLRLGSISDRADQDAKTREWNYRIEGRDPDGRWITITFCFRAINRAFLITANSQELAL